MWISTKSVSVGYKNGGVGEAQAAKGTEVDETQKTIYHFNSNPNN